MDARFALVRQRNLRGIVSGSSIIDYHKVAAHTPVERYVQDVIDGRRFDTNLSKQLHKGFEPMGIIPNYTSNDPKTLGWGVTIMWRNPDYRPGYAPQMIAIPRYEFSRRPQRRAG